MPSVVPTAVPSGPAPPANPRDNAPKAVVQRAAVQRADTRRQEGRPTRTSGPRATHGSAPRAFATQGRTRPVTRFSCRAVSLSLARDSAPLERPFGSGPETCGLSD